MAEFKDIVGGTPVEDLLRTGVVAKMTGQSRATIWRACRAHPGFGVKIFDEYRIPRSHAERLRAGEPIAAIAAGAADHGDAQQAA